MGRTSNNNNMIELANALIVCVLSVFISFIVVSFNLGGNSGYMNLGYGEMGYMGWGCVCVCVYESFLLDFSFDILIS